MKAVYRYECSCEHLMHYSSVALFNTKFMIGVLKQFKNIYVSYKDKVDIKQKVKQ